jgi:hypothetical protein
MFKLVDCIWRYAPLYKTFYHPCQEMCDKNLEYVNPSVWGHLNFELNCAVVYSK